jgi:hypothetical protein
MLVDCLIEWEDGGVVEPHKHSLLRAPTRHDVLQQNNNRVKDVRKNSPGCMIENPPYNAPLLLVLLTNPTTNTMVL